MIDVTAPKTLSGQTRTLVGEQRLFTSIALIALGTLLLTLSAKIQVPFYPVPMTMQTFMVLLLGFTLGPRLAGATVLAYLVEGLAGLPVFSGTPERGLGLAYMAGPTGGYLVGFLLAALATGFLAERSFDRNLGTAALAALAGMALIYIPGLLWLGTLIGWDKPVLDMGLWLYMPAEAFKLMLLACLLPLAWKIRGYVDGRSTQ